MLICNEPSTGGSFSPGQLNPDQLSSTNYASTAIIVVFDFCRCLPIINVSRYLFVLDFLTCCALRTVDVLVKLPNFTIKSMFAFGAGGLLARPVSGGMSAIMDKMSFCAHLIPREFVLRCCRGDLMEAGGKELAETFVVLIDHDADFEAGVIVSETVRSGLLGCSNTLQENAGCGRYVNTLGMKKARWRLLMTSSVANGTESDPS